MTFPLRLLFSLALMGLAACSGGTLHPLYVDSRYNPVTMANLPYRDGFRLEVAGNPFAMKDEDFAAAVSEAVTKDGPRPAGPLVRVVFAANPAASADSACSTGSETGFAPEGGIGVILALCDHKSVLTYRTGRIAGIASPADPKFRTFLRQGVRSLFPKSDPDDRRERDPACFLGPDC